MGRAPKQLISKNNNQSTNSADNLTAWIHRDPHMWITRLLAVPVLEVSAGARHSAGVALLFGPHCCRGSVMGLWCPRLLLPLLLSHNPGAVMKDVAFSGTRLRVAGFGCGRGVIFAEDND